MNTRQQFYIMSSITTQLAGLIIMWQTTTVLSFCTLLTLEEQARSTLFEVAKTCNHLLLLSLCTQGRTLIYFNFFSRKGGEKSLQYLIGQHCK